ncbi:catalase [Vibrio lentus]|nr:catalase [Vibrio lentus]
MLQGRLFAYADTQLFIAWEQNLFQLPVNRPLAPVVTITKMG